MPPLYRSSVSSPYHILCQSSSYISGDVTNLIPHDVQNLDRIPVIRVIRLTVQKHVFANSRVAIVVPDPHDLGSQAPVVHEANIGGIILASLDQILGFRVVLFIQNNGLRGLAERYELGTLAESLPSGSRSSSCVVTRTRCSFPLGSSVPVVNGEVHLVDVPLSTRPPHPCCKGWMVDR